MLKLILLKSFDIIYLFLRYFTKRDFLAAQPIKVAFKIIEKSPAGAFAYCVFLTKNLYHIAVMDKEIFIYLQSSSSYIEIIVNKITKINTN